MEIRYNSPTNVYQMDILRGLILVIKTIKIFEDGGLALRPTKLEAARKFEEFGKLSFPPDTSARFFLLSASKSDEYDRKDEQFILSEAEGNPSLRTFCPIVDLLIHLIYSLLLYEHAWT